MTSDGSNTYQWDAEGRMVSVNSGSTWSATYNAFGQRVERISTGGRTEELYDPSGRLLGHLNGANGVWWEEYVPFDGRLLWYYTQATNVSRYFHVNALGSLGLATDQTGASVEEMLYYPFGDRWQNTTGFGWDEKFAQFPQRDEDIQMYMSTFREDNPGLGRWMSPDPLGGDVTNPQSLNRYAYVLNNPTSLTDPMGLDSGNPADPCSADWYYYSHAECGGSPPGDCEEYDLGSCSGNPFPPLGGYGGGGYGGGGGTVSSAPPAGQPPLRGGAGFISPNDAAVWEQIEQQYPWIVSTVWTCAYAPVCQEVLAGAAVGVAVGYGVAKLQNYIHQVRGQSDAVSGVKPVNPGRDASGNCNPCPESPPAWEVPGSQHGSTTGTHWHWIEWNQNPLTCTCYPKRKSGPSAP